MDCAQREPAPHSATHRTGLYWRELPDQRRSATRTARSDFERLPGGPDFQHFRYGDLCRQLRGTGPGTEPFHRRPQPAGERQGGYRDRGGRQLHPGKLRGTRSASTGEAGALANSGRPAAGVDVAVAAARMAVLPGDAQGAGGSPAERGAAARSRGQRYRDLRFDQLLSVRQSTSTQRHGTRILPALSTGPVERGARPPHVGRCGAAQRRGDCRGCPTIGSSSTWNRSPA